MGFACPVCETPQSDGEHLANHLAFAAIMGDDEHESWLDEHAPGWDDQGPDELAPRVTEHALETEYPQVFEDTVDDRHDHRLEDELQQAGGYGRSAGNRNAEMGAEARAILDEARRMTEKMRDEDGAEDENE
ncbi:DUF5810 domain-containing protein [Haladaptatus halobius]|jgi:hypothetical protein|uniref:DUF5810 domain-containing protein n=1 Tax=Haladaptatus halobius TaxID=2884875 RepID=UPI001D09D129|nr:DUF5810 domain-containing protein [Haladaptatus halobius]